MSAGIRHKTGETNVGVNKLVRNGVELVSSSRLCPLDFEGVDAIPSEFREERRRNILS